MLISVKQLLSKYVFYDKMIPQYQLFSKTIFLLKRETSFAYLFRPNFYVVKRGFAGGGLRKMRIDDYCS